jgi:hypothetical protein
MARFIWANHNELINLDEVSMVRLLVDDKMAHAFFPGSDKPVMMSGSAALTLLEGMAGERPAKPIEE